MPLVLAITAFRENYLNRENDTFNDKVACLSLMSFRTNKKDREPLPFAFFLFIDLNSDQAPPILRAFVSSLLHLSLLEGKEAALQVPTNHGALLIFLAHKCV